MEDLKVKKTYMQMYLDNMDSLAKIGRVSNNQYESTKYNYNARIVDPEELDKILDMSSSGPEMLKAVIVKVNELQLKFSEMLGPVNNLKGKIDYLRGNAGEYHNNEKVSSQIDELMEFTKDFEDAIEDFSNQFRFQRNAFEELEKEGIENHVKGRKQKTIEF